MAKSKRTSTVFSKVRHEFKIAIWNPITEKEEVKGYWARVRMAKKPVTLTLTADHVRNSIKNHGVADTTKCSMAVCTVKHKDAFPHKVTGYIDWQYSRVFISSKNREGIIPDECYVYEHKTKVAQLNDTMKKNTAEGQQKLLEMLESTGPIEIVLLPYRRRSAPKRNGTKRKRTGKRNNYFKGAKARMAHARSSGGLALE